ncbi:hypothetical protein N7489_010108 [Penicillium chrysogenum]|uniref:Zn(2)-C6 fungal-type domain-containing protein n=1 Tax=Penicillium chrysogenum TaxID=5076 RepID=A0ABQ8WUL0_PENCH|nr:uncharacterized protein N7489_010108 [Penicillium chrysogenum]KAJ5229400.1 hypothetical protein N7489_010108 [Penicillium chrysogenum]KAJ5282718.1 hypothetical protein N7505_000698 [Penicillium chrysogenum]KAJ6169275.1 hypothetical protein N7497_002118 [Penicillium chrysogenum]
MVYRRSHAKSRHGCSNCKQRRVKCGEERPHCTNCVQRKQECVYSTEGPYFFAGKQRKSKRTRQSSIAEQNADPFLASVSATEGHLGAAQTSSVVPTLNMEQLELELQWITETHQLLARNEETRKVWEVQVLQEALHAPFLMHGILGLSALHLSRLRDEKSRTKWLSIAISHKNVALSIFSEQLSNIDQSNAKAMMSFAGLVVAFRFGSSLTPGSPDGPSLASLIDIFTLARGVQTISSQQQQFLLKSNFAPLFNISPPELTWPEDIVDAFRRLEELNVQCGQQFVHHDTAIYERDIAHLRSLSAFTLVEPQSMTLIGGFAIRASKHFLHDLNNGHPFALIVLAHYCGFLHMARENWCVGPWGSIVLQDIQRLLPPDWQHYLEWPVQQVWGTGSHQSEVLMES